MSFTISNEDKDLIKLSCEWMKSKKKEDSCTSILTEVLNDRISYDNSYNNLRHLDLTRRCKEIKELIK